MADLDRRAVRIPITWTRGDPLTFTLTFVGYTPPAADQWAVAMYFEDELTLLQPSVSVAGQVVTVQFSEELSEASVNRTYTWSLKNLALNTTWFGGPATVVEPGEAIGNPGNLALGVKVNNANVTVKVTNPDASSSAPTALSELTDVDLTDPSEGQSLVYDEADETWKNQDVVADGDGGITTFIMDEVAAAPNVFDNWADFQAAVLAAPYGLKALLLRGDLIELDQEIDMNGGFWVSENGANGTIIQCNEGARMVNYGTLFASHSVTIVQNGSAPVIELLPGREIVVERGVSLVGGIAAPLIVVPSTVGHGTSSQPVISLQSNCRICKASTLFITGNDGPAIHIEGTPDFFGIYMSHGTNLLEDNMVTGGAETVGVKLIASTGSSSPEGETQDDFEGLWQTNVGTSAGSLGYLVADEDNWAIGGIPNRVRSALDILADRVTTLESLPGGAGTLASLSDVVITSPDIDQVLMYDFDSSSWVNRSLTPGENLTFINDGPFLWQQDGHEVTLMLGVGGIKGARVVIPGGSTSVLVQHDLGTTAVIVQVFKDLLSSTPGQQTVVPFDVIDPNTIELYFPTAPTTGQYYAVILGLVI